MASFFSSEFNSVPAKGVLVIEGAIQFTLIFGANSAASALVNPSPAPFEDATNEGKLKPVCTATVENKTTDA